MKWLLPWGPAWTNGVGLSCGLKATLVRAPNHTYGSLVFALREGRY